MSDVTKLQDVADAVIRRGEREAEAKIAAEAWVVKQLADADADIERAVMAALDDGHSKTDVARAYTISGKTPNRNAIHSIVKKNESLMDVWSGEYPFEWKKRTTTTARGKRTVFDVFADLNAFGPNEVSGEYTWRFDTGTGVLEALLTDRDPYPTDKFYKQVLDRWVMTHPYPGKE